MLGLAALAPTNAEQDTNLFNLTSVGLNDKITLTWESTSASATYNVYSLDENQQRKDKLNDEPISTCCYSFDYPADEGDVQHKEYFMVTQVMDEVESQGIQTGVIIGRPYPLPYSYNFSPKGYWEGRSHFVVIPDKTYWEGENAFITNIYGTSYETSMWLQTHGSYSSYTTGKIEVHHNTYVSFDYQTYKNLYGAWDYSPEPTIEVYGIDPYGNATKLTTDGTGLGYLLDPVADFPWARIQLQIRYDYDNDLWLQNYYWLDNGPECYFTNLYVTHHSELATNNFAVVDGICYQIRREDREAIVVNPKLIDGQPAYSGDLCVPDSITANGVSYPVKGLAEDAFEDADQVTSLELPATIDHWQASSFKGLNGLTSLYVHHTQANPNRDAPLGTEAFTFISSQCTLYVPAGTMQHYRSADSWNRFYRISEFDYDTREVLNTDLHETIIYSYEINYFLSYDINLAHQTAEVCENLLYRDDPIQSVYWGDVSIPATIDYYGLPCRVTALGQKALSHCYNLTSLSLPSNIQIKSSTPFIDCSRLSSIKLNVLPPVFCQAPPYIQPELLERCTLYVPLGCKETYQRLAVWKKFNIEESADIVPDTDESLVLDTETELNLKYDNINHTAEVIATPYGYRGNIVIPNTVIHDHEKYAVTSVSDEAFRNCYELVSIVYGDNVTSCPKSLAYNNCLSLTQVSFGKSMGHAGDGLFWQYNTGDSPSINLDFIKFCSPYMNIDWETFIGLGSCGKVIFETSVSKINNLKFLCFLDSSTRIVCQNPEPPELPGFLPPEELNLDVNYWYFTLYVPYGSRQNYLQAEGWQLFGQIIEVDDEGNEYPDDLGIEHVHPDTTAQGTTYSLDGKRTSSPARGLYIVNGQKVLFGK